jgi:hypothetical protein
MKSGLFLCLPLVAAAVGARTPPPVPVTVIRAGTLIDGTSPAPKRDQAEDGKVYKKGAWGGSVAPGRMRPG